MKPPLPYHLLHDKYYRARRRSYTLQRRFQSLVDARLLNYIVTNHPRRKIPPYPRNNYADVYSDLFNAVMPRYTAHQERLLAAEKRLKAILDHRAPRSVVVPLPEPRVVMMSSASDHYTQGLSAATYARNAAEAFADRIRAAGIPVTVAEPERYSTGAYTVSAPLDAAGVDQINRRPLDLVTVVQNYWKRGANPRVFLPFLPHGFEAQYGLDYFGNRTA